MTDSQSLKEKKEIDEINKIKRYIKITELLTVLVAALCVLIIIITYLKKMWNASRRALQIIKDFGEDSKDFIIATGDKFADGIQEAIDNTVKRLKLSQDKAVEGVAPVGDNVNELGQTVKDTVGEVGDHITERALETQNNAQKITNAFKELKPSVMLGKWANLSDGEWDIIEGPVDGDDPVEVNPDDAKQFVGRWRAIDEDLHDDPPFIINITLNENKPLTEQESKDGIKGHYKFNYNPSYVFGDGKKIGYDPNRTYFELMHYKDALYGEATAGEGRVPRKFLLRPKLYHDNHIEMILFWVEGLAENEDVTEAHNQVYDPDRGLVFTFNREGDVQYDDDGNMIF